MAAARILVVNADDLGANAPRNRGVLEAHRRGVVTSATVLANLPSAEEAVAEARKTSPGLGLGLHLNLTEGRSLARGHATLAAPDRSFWGKDEARRLLTAGLVDPAEIRREIEAQLDWFSARGLTPTHVDGHHHVHIYPGVMGSLAAVMGARGIRRIRLPRALLGGTAGIPADRMEAVRVYAALTPEARRLADAAGLKTTEAFLGMTLMGDMTVPAVLGALSGAPEGVTEVMAHPGYADPASGGFSSPEREREVALLTDPGLREGLGTLGFRLASFAALD